MFFQAKKDFIEIQHLQIFQKEPVNYFQKSLIEKNYWNKEKQIKKILAIH